MPDSELAEAVGAVRERVGAPIAIVTPNRPEDERARAIVVPGDYVFARAGSPSETRIAELGVACALFLTREGLGDRARWSMTPVGECGKGGPAAEPLPEEPTTRPPRSRLPPLDPLADYHRHTRTARTALMVLPIGAIAVLAGVQTGVNHGWEPQSGALVAAGTVTLLVAPGFLAGGSLSAANDLLAMGIPVSRDGGHAAWVFYAIAMGSPLTVVGVVAFFPIGYIGAIASGCSQLQANTRAFEGSGRAPHVRLQPILTPDERGLAVVGTF